MNVMLDFMYGLHRANALSLFGIKLNYIHVRYCESNTLKDIVTCFFQGVRVVPVCTADVLKETWIVNTNAIAKLALLGNIAKEL